MPEPSARHASDLAAFLQAYAERLPARIAAIEEGWNVVCNQNHSNEELDALFYRIHNLRGSAATCGFRAVSELAEVLETIVRSVGKDGTPPTASQRSEFALQFAELERAGRRSVGGQRSNGK